MKNREIKFRTWDKEEKKMFTFNKDGSELLFSSGNIEIWENGKAWPLDKFGEVKDGDGFALMQFTGLKDKNGKEIYEGDIVKFGKKADSLNQIAPIIWNQKSWAFNPFTKPLTGPRRMFEIIGNIYENPELLK